MSAVEARLRELDAARGGNYDLAELRAQSERAIPDGAGENEPDRTTSWTPQRKVALFASLFDPCLDTLLLAMPIAWKAPSFSTPDVSTTPIPASTTPAD
jgi:hypothetical protein